MEPLERLLDHIKLHEDELAQIMGRDGIAVCVYKSPQGEALKALQSWGWKGEPLFRMRSVQRKAIAKAWVAAGNDHGAKWLLAKRRNGRILVIAGNGTLLVNFEPGKGYTIEPGAR